MKDPKDMSATELLSVFCVEREYRNAVAAARAWEQSDEARRLASPPPQGWLYLKLPGRALQEIRAIRAPSPEREARWAAVWAEIDKRFAR